MEKNEKQRLPLRYEIYAAVGIVIITFSVTGLIWFLMPHLGVDLRKMSSFFVAYRTLLAMAIPMLVVLGAFFIEFLVKDWKKRGFRWRNVLGAVGMFAIFLCVTLPLLTIFDVLSSWLNIEWQISLAVIGSSLGLVIMGLATRTKALKEWLRA